MNEEQLPTILGVIYLLLILNLIAPIVLALVSMWTNAAFRTEWQLALPYQKLKYSWFDEVKDESDVMMTWALFDLSTGLLLGIVATFLVTVVPPLLTLVVFLLVISPFAVRVVADMFRTLRMNYKTGDSDRLAKLEEEIRRIKGERL